MKTSAKHILSAMTAFALATGCAVSCTGCSTGAETSSAPKSEQAQPAETPESSYTASEAAEKLISASEIVVDKDFINFGDHWTVYADGEHVSDINGEFIKIWDVYVMRSTNGEFMCAEEENIGLVTARAAKVDEKGNEIGRYDQNISMFLLNISIKDANGTEIGKLEQNLDLVLDCSIKDGNGNDAWYADKAFLTLGAKITITKGNGNLPVEDAIMASVIANELVEARN